MANPHKQDLSRGLADMKFMKRQSYDEVDFDTGGPLTDKWVVKNVSKPSTCSQRLSVTGSYVEFEELNEFGRFSYNSFNKDVERMMASYKKQCEGESEGELMEEEDEGEVSVKISEMAKQYKDLKLLGKRRRNNNLTM